MSAFLLLPLFVRSEDFTLIVLKQQLRIFRFINGEHPGNPPCPPKFKLNPSSSNKNSISSPNAKLKGATWGSLSGCSQVLHVAGAYTLKFKIGEEKFLCTWKQGVYTSDVSQMEKASTFNTIYFLLWGMDKLTELRISSSWLLNYMVLLESAQKITPVLHPEHIKRYQDEIRGWCKRKQMPHE